MSASSNWPSATGKSILNTLYKLDFELYKINGSHYVLFRPDDPKQRLVHVMIHGDKEWKDFQVKEKWEEVNEIVEVSEERFKRLLRKSH